MKFYKEPAYWTLSDREHLQLEIIESHGNNLDELMENCTIVLVDWHGNDGPAWDFGDLARKDFDAVEQLFIEFLQQVDEGDPDLARDEKMQR